VFVPAQKWFVDNLKIKNVTVDFDSSVMIRYGEKERREVEYNLSEPVRSSHHPLMTFTASTRIMANSCPQAILLPRVIARLSMMRPLRF